MGSAWSCKVMRDAAPCGNGEGAQLVDQLSITWNDPFVSRTERSSAGDSQTSAQALNGAGGAAGGREQAGADAMEG